MRILITGSGGMLGAKLMSIMRDHEITGLERQDMDISVPSTVERTIHQYHPDIIINSAAFTKVDDCESIYAQACSANAEGPRVLASICSKEGIKLVHVSTDYVFDGRKTGVYTEEDATNPLSAYGMSKLAGEQNITSVMDDHIIVRTQWLYGENGPNFVETIRRIAGERDELRVVNDQYGSPTYTTDLSLAIKSLIEHECRGIYHAANSGSCTWFEFAGEILRQIPLSRRIVPISTEELSRPATRPANSVFDCSKLRRDTGFVFRDWKDALQEYMSARRVG